MGYAAGTSSALSGLPASLCFLVDTRALEVFAGWPWFLSREPVAQSPSLITGAGVKQGIVLEVRGRTAIVLTPDGQFLRVAAAGEGWWPGQEVVWAERVGSRAGLNGFWH